MKVIFRDDDGHDFPCEVGSYRELFDYPYRRVKFANKYDFWEKTDNYIESEFLCFLREDCLYLFYHNYNGFRLRFGFWDGGYDIFYSVDGKEWFGVVDLIKCNKIDEYFLRCLCDFELKHCLDPETKEYRLVHESNL